jgi:hypothetical protein
MSKIHYIKQMWVRTKCGLYWLIDGLRENGVRLIVGAVLPVNDVLRRGN